MNKGINYSTASTAPVTRARGAHPRGRAGEEEEEAPLPKGVAGKARRKELLR